MCSVHPKHFVICYVFTYLCAGNALAMRWQCVGNAPEAQQRHSSNAAPRGAGVTYALIDGASVAARSSGKL